ncbi:MAG TPA: nitrilase-related carbon-nitrogen hydrolase [Cellulomonas sp.]
MSATTIAVAQLSPRDDRDANVADAATLIDEAAGLGARLVVLPELFAVPFVPAVPGEADYLRWAEPLDGPSNAMAAAKSAEHDIAVVSSIFEATSTPGVFHNTATTFVGGRPALVYRKSHLPLSNNFPEKYYFSPGSERPSVVEAHGLGVATLICYERHFPELARTAAVQGATVLAVPIASATAYSRSIFEIELKAHAVFNCLYVASANRIGDEGPKSYFGGSALYGPDGQTLAQAADHGGPELVVAEIDVDGLAAKRLTERPFLRDRRPELYL